MLLKLDAVELLMFCLLLGVYDVQVFWGLDRAIDGTGVRAKLQPQLIIC